MAWNSNLHWRYSWTKEVDWWRHYLIPLTLSKNGFWAINYISVTRPMWWRHLFSPFVKGYHLFKFQFHAIYGGWNSRWDGGGREGTSILYKVMYIKRTLHIVLASARKWHHLKVHRPIFQKMCRKGFLGKIANNGQINN